MLSGFGRFLLDHTRASDVPARIGGDEFAVILPDTDAKAAHNLKIRLGKRLEVVNVIDQDGLKLKASASFGVAGYPAEADSVDELMIRADADMYADKNLQKNTSVAAATLRAAEPADVTP
jgi:diguanylate cyclase (GGDEF)-like protein